MININVKGTDYPVPSSAADTNWAAKQVAFQQALANGINASSGGSGINAADYGFSESATPIENSAALAAALAAAQLAAVELFINPGTFGINGHDLAPVLGGPTSAAVSFLASTTMRGAGAEFTVLEIADWVEPTYSDPNTILAQNDNGAAFLYCAPLAGIRVHLADLTLRGPPEADLTHILSNVWGIYAAGGGSLTLERVYWENFNQSLKLSPNYPAYPGTGTRLRMFDCYNQFRGQGILGIAYAGSQDFNDQLTCRHRYQNDLAALISAPGAGVNDSRHCMYIANGVSLRTMGNSYLATGGEGGESGCAWRHYSVGDSDVPEYSESIGEYVASDCAAAFIPNPNFQSSIIDPTIHSRDANGNTAIQLAGPALIDGPHFVGAGGSFGISDGAFTGGRATLSNAIFEGDWTYAISRTNAVADRWKIGPNVELRHASSDGGSGIRILGGGMDIDGLALDVQGAGTGASIFFKGGDVSLTNVRSATGCAAMVIAADDANLAVDFGPGVTWDDNTRPIITPAAHNVALSGQPDFYQGNGFTLTDAPAGTLSGAMQAGRGVGTCVYDSNRLTLSWDGDLFIVDEGGGPTINNLNMLGSIAGAAALNDLNAWCQATIRLYVKQAFTLGNAGNIVATGGARTVTRIVTLTYMSTLATPKWVEVIP